MSSLKNQYALEDPHCLTHSSSLSHAVKQFGSFLKFTDGSSWAIFCEQNSPIRLKHQATCKTAEGNQKMYKLKPEHKVIKISSSQQMFPPPVKAARKDWNKQQ